MLDPATICLALMFLIFIAMVLVSLAGIVVIVYEVMRA